MKLWKFHSRYDETLKPRGSAGIVDRIFSFFFFPLSLSPFHSSAYHSHSYAGRATRGLRVCLSFLMKDSRLALAFRERRINETGKIPWRTFNWRRVRRARVGAFEKVEQGPARNRRTFVRKLDERVIKLRKKHVGRDADYTFLVPAWWWIRVGDIGGWEEDKRTGEDLSFFQEIIAGRMFNRWTGRMIVGRGELNVG